MDIRKRFLSSQLFSSILEDELGLAEHLLKTGADPNLLLEKFGMMPFHVAVGEIEQPEMFTLLLLNFSANPNVRSTEGLTPLHVACIYNNCQCVEMLMQHGGDPFLADEEGKNAFWCVGQTRCRRCLWTLKKYSGHREKLLEKDEAEGEVTSSDPFTQYSSGPDFEEDYEEELKMLHHDDSGNHAQINDSDSSELFRDVDANDWTNDLLSTVLEEDEEAITDSNNEKEKKERSENKRASYPSRRDSDVATHPYASPVQSNGTLFPAVYENKTPSTESSPVDAWSQTSSPDNPDSSRLSPENFDNETFCDNYGCTCQNARNFENERTGHSETSRLYLDENSTMMLSGTSKLSVDEKSTLIVHSPEPDDTAVVDRVVTCDSDQKKTEKKKPCCFGNTSASFTTLTPENFVLYDSTDCSFQSHVPSNVDPVDLSLANDSSNSWPSAYTWTLSQFFKNLSLVKEEVGDGKTNGESHKNIKSADEQQDLPEFTDDESVCNQGFYLTHDYAIRKGPSSINVNSNEKSDSSYLFINDSGFTSFAQPKSSSRNCTANSMLFDASCSIIKDDSHHAHVANASASANRSGTKHTKPSRLSQENAVANKPVMTSPLTEAALKVHQSKLSKGREVLSSKFGGSVRSGRTADSQCSCQSTATIRYVVSDDDADSVMLLETHFPITNLPCDAHSAMLNSSIASWQNFPQNSSVCGKNCDLNATMGIIRAYNAAKLRSELEKLGDFPGPITTATRPVYERRLHQLRLDPSLARIALNAAATYSAELEQALSLKLNVSDLQELEDKMSEPFHQPDPNRRWREGNLKASFIYLLLDPRITRNLPNRAKQLGDEESFKTFVKSIFYVGKGKRARPYAHFKEAIKHDPNKTPGKKVGHILSIWNDGEGVVSLHIFQSIMAVEAYTREAAIIDTIGIRRLTNVRLGDYYGPACTWPAKKKRLLGVRLLKKAFRIFLSEGERQIRPSDLKL